MTRFSKLFMLLLLGVMAAGISSCSSDDSVRGWYFSPGVLSEGYGTCYHFIDGKKVDVYTHFADDPAKETEYDISTRTVKVNDKTYYYLKCMNCEYNQFDGKIVVGTMGTQFTISGDNLVYGTAIYVKQ